MHECCYFCRSPEMFVYINQLNFLGKPVQLAFVLWLKKHIRSMADFAAFVAKAQTRIVNAWFSCLIKRSANNTRHKQHIITVWRLITTWSRQYRHNEMPVTEKKV